jgi:hypothetical protein
VLNVDLQKSRVYELLGGQDVVERLNINASRPDLIYSGESRRLAFSTGSSEEESSLALRCMTTSPSVSPNADGTNSTLSLFDIRRTVDRLTTSGTSSRHGHIGVADA